MLILFPWHSKFTKRESLMFQDVVVHLLNSMRASRFRILFLGNLWPVSLYSNSFMTVSHSDIFDLLCATFFELPVFAWKFEISYILVSSCVNLFFLVVKRYLSDISFNCLMNIPFIIWMAFMNYLISLIYRSSCEIKLMSCFSLSSSLRIPC